MSNLCLTLAETSLSNLSEKITRYSGQIPFIEVRLDYLPHPDLPALPRGVATQFIATCRPVREGGLYQGDERARLDLLRKAGQSGFSWVDVEYDVPECPVSPAETRIIRSRHFLAGFPTGLDSIWRDIVALGGDISKVAVFVSGTRELVTLLRWMESLPHSLPRIVLGMGGEGQASRWLGAFLGNRLTYVAEDAEAAAAPGQFSLRQAVDCYRLPQWQAMPDIYGVIGNPIAHSLSPALHNRLFDHYRLNKIYLPFKLDGLQPWFEYVQSSSLSFRGFSVTLPFKTEVIRYLRTVDSPVNALNTLIRREGGWHGFNTDYLGFLKPLAFTDWAGKTALVLGNGGVAHTVVAALQSVGAQVIVAGRDRTRLTRFASSHGCRSVLLSDLPMRADLCVNTTPVGQYPEVDRSPLDPGQLDFDVVYDLVYHPERTRLLKAAQDRGAVTISGIEMFVEQAALQFVAWTGIEPNRELMRDTIRTSLCQG